MLKPLMKNQEENIKCKSVTFAKDLAGKEENDSK